MNKPKLGSGKRFKMLANKFAHRGIDNPAALAAYVGRKKYGNKKMAQLSEKGREHHAHEHLHA